MPELDEFFVVDGFKMERGEAFYHVKRIAGMCRGLRIPIAWPHDGLHAREGQRASRLPMFIAGSAHRCSATHAENKGGGYHIAPAIEEMCGFMKRGAFMIASHMSELSEEILSYHRDEDYKIVRLRDDLISAVRYAFMMRRSGKLLDDCEAYGRAPGVDGAQYDPRPWRPERRRETQLAAGVDFDVFTGR